jgi:hypothetical protein
MLAGPLGFVHTPDAQRMQIATAPDSKDPVLAHLAPGAAVGVLGLEPHTRRRNRMNGRVTALGDTGLGVQVVQSFGNCPKYIQARQPGLRAALVAPGPMQWLGAELNEAAIARVQRADTLFIASASAPRPGAGHSEGVDVSHRGGEPGFVQVARTEAGVVLSLPDYPGNQFFNTLGNLALHPLAGLLVVDYEEGGLLHIAAQAEVLWDRAARAAWPGAQRVLRLTVAAAGVAVALDTGGVGPSVPGDARSGAGVKGVPAVGCERGGDAAMRLRGTVASASTIFALRSCAVCASSVMSAASGRLCQ